MKKVINITLGSIVFAIEQDAYDTLAGYLEQIKANLASTDDAKEIVDDIEVAIAEKFVLRGRSEKMAVTAEDVNAIMVELGSPLAFIEADGGESAQTGTETTSEALSGTKRRLYRDTDNAIIAGIASGLARYFDIDPVVVRLIFVISVFFNGLGILAYIILWLVVPKAETTSDKYAMRGERITLKEISQRVKKNVNGLDTDNYVTAKGVWFRVRMVLEKLFGLFGALVRFALVVLRYLFGFFLVVGGALSIAAIASFYSVILLSEQTFFPEEVRTAFQIIEGSALGIVALVSSFVAMIIPLLVLIVAGAGLLAKRSYFTTQKTVSLAVVWIIAAMVAGTTSVLQVEQIMKEIGPVPNRYHEHNLELSIDHKDASYLIDGEWVRLNNGYSEKTIPGSSSLVITRYFGNEVATDLDGDGNEDMAFIVMQETGGSGVFYYAVAALATENGYVGSDGYLLGDRIAPQTTEVSQDPQHQHVVVFNYADRALGEPMSTQPTVGKSAYLKLDPESMRWGVVEADFEGESAY